MVLHQSQIVQPLSVLVAAGLQTTRVLGEHRPVRTLSAVRLCRGTHPSVTAHPRTALLQQCADDGGASSVVGPDGSTYRKIGCWCTRGHHTCVPLACLFVSASHAMLAVSPHLDLDWAWATAPTVASLEAPHPQASGQRLGRAVLLCMCRRSS